MTSVAATLRRACDAHAWRAKSFVAALRAMSEASDVDPDALQAIVERLDEHVLGLADALDQAHTALNKAARA